MSASTETKFDDVMMAMDVVDTLRHESSLVETELSGDKRRAALVEKLRAIYLAQGLAVSEDILNRAVDELEDRRFVHQPLKHGLQRTLATIYIRRVRYAVRGAIAAVALTAVIGGSVAITNKLEADRIAAEKAFAVLIEEKLPRDLDAATKAALRLARGVTDSDSQVAAVERLEQDGKVALAARNVSSARKTIADLEGIRTTLENRTNEIAKKQAKDRAILELGGKANAAIAAARDAAKDSQASSAVAALANDLEIAARSGDIARFDRSSANLTALVEEIRLPLTIRIVDRKGVSAGVWRMRNNDPTTKVYYLVVEAERPDGKAFARDVRNSETGKTENVATWAVRVPKDVYERVKADKTSDGIINERDVGFKEAGALGIKWSVSTRGETITKW